MRRDHFLEAGGRRRAPEGRRDGAPRPSRGSAALQLLLLAVLSLACTSAPVPPKPASPRWVSLAPSLTEILFAVGAGGEVAGVCAPVTYPPEAARVRAVASWDRVDTEALVAIAPTACFTVEGMQGPQPLDALRRLGVEVHVYPMRSLADLRSCILDVGARTGHAAEAARLTAAMDKRTASADPGPRFRRLPVLVLVGLDPLVAAGPESFLSEVLQRAGFRNALSAGGEPYPALSLEDAAEADPSAVVYPQGEIGPEAVRAFLAALQRVLGRPVAAVPVPADLLVRPGPRTVDAVEMLSRVRKGMAP